MKNKYNNVLTIISRIFFMILGSILVSIGLEIFLIPNNIIDGGMTGISIMASHLTKAQLGIFIFIFNLPFVIVGYKQIGKTFALSTIFSVICLSIGVTFTSSCSWYNTRYTFSNYIWWNYNGSRSRINYKKWWFIRWN